MTGASWTKSVVLLNFESETNLSYPRWPMSQVDFSRGFSRMNADLRLSA